MELGLDPDMPRCGELASGGHGLTISRGPLRTSAWGIALAVACPEVAIHVTRSITVLNIVAMRDQDEAARAAGAPLVGVAR
ncbi:MAG: hypothetical protein AAGI28_16190 [Pseudomonadota bacterium]